MLKGDIGLLAENCGVSKTTIYRIADKIGLDLAPIHGRCDKTVDYISGTTLADERDMWLDMATEKILKYRKERRERRARNRAMDKVAPKQMEIV
jgi:hypothetical protein